jgi:hypothetical protein
MREGYRTGGIEVLDALRTHAEKRAA